MNATFFSVGRAYRYIDVWEFARSGWIRIYSQPELLVLDDRDALSELGAIKTRYFKYGRIYRLWTWNGVWNLTRQS
jgi:hypothetical protein